MASTNDVELYLERLEKSIADSIFALVDRHNAYELRR